MDYYHLFIAAAFIAFVVWCFTGRHVLDAIRGGADTKPLRLAHLPEQFVVFDLETTGLSAATCKIIEFGAIKISRDDLIAGSNQHQAYAQLVAKRGPVPAKIVEITGITTEMLKRDGIPMEQALPAFLEFIGDLPLVSFNAKFDMEFLHAAAAAHGRVVRNKVSCALKMARRAWPGKTSYRLGSLAKDAGLDVSNAHRALADALLAVHVYAAAASKLQAVA